MTVQYCENVPLLSTSTTFRIKIKNVSILNSLQIDLHRLIFSLFFYPYNVYTNECKCVTLLMIQTCKSITKIT